MDGDPVLSNGTHLNSLLVVRVAGLPRQALDMLRFDRTATLVEDVRARGEWLRAEGNALADALHPIIGNLPGGPERPALVGLRRALHNGRLPTRREWHEVIEALLPPPVARRVQEWTLELRRHNHRHKHLNDMLATEFSAKLPILREITSEPSFRRALAHASEALSGELEKWLLKPSHRPRRQAISRLAKYVSRATAKTSPYSTFTSSGIGRWADDGPARRFKRGLKVDCVLELNGTLPQELVARLVADPRLTPTLHLRANPSITIQDEVVTFIGQPPLEKIITMPSAPAVMRCLQIIDGDARLTMREVREKLAEGQTDTDRIARFLDRLVNVGLLEIVPPVTDQASDPLGDLSQWLRDSDADQAFRDIVVLIDRLRTQLGRDVPVERVADQHRRLDALDAAGGALVDEVGQISPPPFKAPATVAHESAVFSDTVVTCSLPAWRPALDDLDVTRRWLAALDPSLPLRIALSDFCRTRFGPGATVPFPLVLQAVCQDASSAASSACASAAEISRFLTEMSPGTLDDCSSPRLRRLHRIRQDARRAVYEPSRPESVQRTDPVKLETLIQGWPSWVVAPPSLCCYVQGIRDGDSFGLVVNVAHTGYGRGHSRWTHLLDRVRGAPNGHRPLYTQPDILLAELTGMFGFSLNRRAASVAYEIDYPLSSGTRPADERIPLCDLEVRHDARTDLVKLYSRRRRMEVRVLHLGLMSEALLPPAARLLALAFGGGYYLHPSMPLLHSEENLTVPDSVVRVPRCAVGRVVVQRAMWIAPTGEIPSRAKGEKDGDHLVRLITWLCSHNIPIRCYVRMWAKEFHEDTSRWERLAFDKSRKPMYVDFESVFLVMAFEVMLKRSGPVVLFEEPLPAPDNVAFEDGSDPCVTEFIVELSDKDVRRV